MSFCADVKPLVSYDEAADRIQLEASLSLSLQLSPFFFSLSYFLLMCTEPLKSQKMVFYSYDVLCTNKCLVSTSYLVHQKVIYFLHVILITHIILFAQINIFLQKLMFAQIILLMLSCSYK